MAFSAFPYTGGKTALAPWIAERLPEHTVYVEPFGGSAAVLLNKPRSNIEVYNDRDSDVVQFFEIARDRPDELAEWVRRTPYSEQLHAEWAEAFYAGERPDDPVERAGRFLLLRYSQYAGKYKNKSGFKRDNARTRVGDSRVWSRVPARIEELCERLQGVCILDDDFADVIDFYDSPDAVFYCDPPYVGKEDSYLVNDFDHRDLADALQDIEGYALVSYTEVPDGHYRGWTELTRQHHHDSGAQMGKPEEEVTERLLLNYDPKRTPRFVDGQQQTLPTKADGGRLLSSSGGGDDGA